MIRREPQVKKILSKSLVLLLQLAACASLVWPLASGQSAVAQTAQASVNFGDQSPYLGSIPTGEATSAPISLSIQEALQRGLKYNLGLTESNLNTQASRAGRLKALSHLLPNINASFTQSVEQIDLKAMGINFPGVPTTVGPFGVQDARAFLSQKLFDWNAVEKLRASTEQLKAAQLNYQDSRDIVVLAVGNAYLLTISDAANVESQEAQLKTSQALYQKAIDRREAGLAAKINETRAKVEMQTQQQRLIEAHNRLAKDKLSLARIIGLPAGQEFMLTDTVPYAPLEGATLQKALEDAYTNRSDYLSAQAAVRAAGLSRKAAAAERYPTLSTELNYGGIGPNLANSHGTVAFAATVNVPIFLGGKVKADELQADAAFQRRQAELDNLRGRIDEEVRDSLLDLDSTRELVGVSKSNLDLANETLAQAKDRFAAGVTDNLEVVQAQESVASANQAYITSLYRFNIAKVELAKAAGVAERAVKKYLGGN